MPAERSSAILLIAITGVILLLLLSSIWLVHRTDTAPKAPLHSQLRPQAALLP